MNKIISGNSLDVLKTMESESVDCIITSPPYYQLRNYGQSNEEIGKEETPQEYIAKLMDIFDECYRVLKNDGTMFVNISDTYVGTGIKNPINDGAKESYRDYSTRKNPKTIKKKSLIGIPSRLEIALIDSGWILRNEIIWHKPNVMPSSVKDRFTIDFEKIFFLTKSQKYYFKQQKEVMKTQDLSQPRGSKGVINQLNGGLRNIGQDRYEPPKDYMRNKRTLWSISTQASAIEHFAMYPEELVETMIDCGCKKNGIVLDPFAGAGTTLKVAKKLGYNYIGIELYEENCNIIEKRLKEVVFQESLEI